VLLLDCIADCSVGRIHVDTALQEGAGDSLFEFSHPFSVRSLFQASADCPSNASINAAFSCRSFSMFLGTISRNES